MKPTLRGLKAIVEHPATQLASGMILFISGVASAYYDFTSAEHRFRLGVHHGARCGAWCRCWAAFLIWSKALLDPSRQSKNAAGSDTAAEASVARQLTTIYPRLHVGLPDLLSIDTRTGVDDNDYQVPFRFSGKIGKLTVELKP